MRNSLRTAALAIVAAVGLISLTPTAAHAGKKGRRNTALALGAVAAYGIIKKKPVIAGVAGAGAVYSWLQSNKVDDGNRRRQRARQRNRRYNSGYAGDRYYDNGYYGGRAYNSGYGGYDGRSYGYSSHPGKAKGHYKNRSGRGRRCD